MKSITVPALTEQLDTVLQFVQNELDQINCPLKICNQIAIAVEEIFVNIAHYAYRPDVGDATIRCQVSTSGQPQITVEFLDSGKPYDPLKNADPDTTLSAEERDIGGPGHLHGQAPDGRCQIRIQRREKHPDHSKTGVTGYSPFPSGTSGCQTPCPFRAGSLRFGGVGRPLFSPSDCDIIV